MGAALKHPNPEGNDRLRSAASFLSGLPRPLKILLRSVALMSSSTTLGAKVDYRLIRDCIQRLDPDSIGRSAAVAEMLGPEASERRRCMLASESVATPMTSS